MESSMHFRHTDVRLAILTAVLTSFAQALSEAADAVTLRSMTGRNSAVSAASPPKPPSKSSRNAPHPTTRKRPPETLRPFAPRTQTFGVSGCRRFVRRVANARKFWDYSGERGNYKHAAI